MNIHQRYEAAGTIGSFITLMGSIAEKYTFAVINMTHADIFMV
ncbi:hypothetical protein [Paenibacillus sp. V4I7]|nr:hypothetical protein [Paenibacillus sp. V4I7]MDQ0897749.1 hypothetical protein [Paenibacillus sp. V4I7]